MNAFRQPALIRESARGYERIELEDELLSGREVFLSGPVDSGSMDCLLKQLMVLDRMDPETPVTLYINSPGGEVQSGLAVFDCIRLMSAPVNTVCIGTAASMGAILFMAGRERRITPHSRIMIHDPANGSPLPEGLKPAELEERLGDLRSTQHTLSRIIAETTGKSEEEILTLTAKDTWFSAEEAVAFGIATHIMSAEDGKENR